jgi:RNA polymerase sigma factor (TIGR02999 family)
MPSEPSLHGEPLPATSSGDVTGLLLAWGAGDPGALDALIPVVYAELRRQAERFLRREATGHTLQPEALIHEAYLRLVDQSRVPWQNRAQFFGVAARCMRRVLVDHGRARGAAKRGGRGVRASLGEADAAVEEPASMLVAVHEALERLAALDPEQARLVELRYFGGLTIQETAAALGISPATVKREWAVARAWLRRELDEADPDETRR